MTSSLLIFTDLDGTLLDHEDYSWAPAALALEKLRETGVPWMLNTSKTAAELTRLRRELGNPHPYVVENGGAVILPVDSLPGQENEEVCFLGRPYAEILEVLGALRLKKDYRFRSFSDLEVSGVMEVTGLDHESARQACERQCSEPLLWNEGEERLAELRRDLELHGLQLVKGGRFHHVMGKTDKGRALCWLRDRFKKLSPGRSLCTVALGDGENDRPMLAAADIAVVIRPHEGQPLWLPGHRRVIRPFSKGPRGWQEAMTEILHIYL